MISFAILLKFLSHCRIYYTQGRLTSPPCVHVLLRNGGCMDHLEGPEGSILQALSQPVLRKLHDRLTHSHCCPCQRVCCRTLMRTPNKKLP